MAENQFDGKRNRALWCIGTALATISPGPKAQDGSRTTGRRWNRAVSLSALGAVAVILGGLSVPGSAALSSGAFKVHAENIEEPEFHALAGLEGREDTANPGPGTGDRILASYSCGAENFDYTESMKSITESNLELHRQGRDSEMKKGPGGWEAVSVLSAPKEILGVDSTLVAIGGIEVAEPKSIMDFINSGEMAMGYMTYYVPRGNTTHTLSAEILSHGSNSQGISFGLFAGDRACKYSKQIDGKFSSPDGSPAFYGETADPLAAGGIYWMAIFAKDGQFYRAGGLPQIEATLSGQRVTNPEHLQDAYSFVAGFSYPEGTEIAATGTEQIYTVAESPYASTPLRK